MGGLVKSLFGGSSQSGSSSNQAFGVLKDPLTGMATTGANTFNDLAGQLGQGFDAYKKNSGFDWQLNTGERNIAGTAAAKGLLNSGSTGKALAGYESNLGNTMYGNYLDKLSGVVGLGNQAAGTLAGAGQVSTSKGSSNNGILSSLFG